MALNFASAEDFQGRPDIIENCQSEVFQPPYFSAEDKDELDSFQSGLETHSKEAESILENISVDLMLERRKSKDLIIPQNDHDLLNYIRPKLLKHQSKTEIVIRALVSLQIQKFASGQEERGREEVKQAV